MHFFSSKRKSSSSSSSSSSKKSVRFPKDNAEEVHEIYHFNDLSEEEVASIWFTDKDYDQIEHGYLEVIKRHLQNTERRGRDRDNKPSSSRKSSRKCDIRGLETQSCPELAARRFLLKTTSIRAVLEEQQRQREINTKSKKKKSKKKQKDVENNNEDDCPDVAIANVYREIAAECIESSYLVGLMDEKEAKEQDQDKEQDKEKDHKRTRSSSYSKRRHRKSAGSSRRRDIPLSPKKNNVALAAYSPKRTNRTIKRNVSRNLRISKALADLISEGDNGGSSSELFLDGQGSSSSPASPVSSSQDRQDNKALSPKPIGFTRNGTIPARDSVVRSRKISKAIKISETKECNSSISSSSSHSMDETKATAAAATTATTTTNTSTTSPELINPIAWIREDSTTTTKKPVARRMSRRNSSRFRTVRFDSKIRVHENENVAGRSGELWYRENEIKKMKAFRKLTVRVVASRKNPLCEMFDFEENDHFVIRGFESFIMDAAIRKDKGNQPMAEEVENYKRKYQTLSGALVVNAVLARQNEQRMGMETSTTKRDNNDKVVTAAVDRLEDLAKESMAISVHCIDEARKLAVKDEQFVWETRARDEAVENLSCFRDCTTTKVPPSSSRVVPPSPKVQQQKKSPKPQQRKSPKQIARERRNNDSTEKPIVPPSIVPPLASTPMTGTRKALRRSSLSRRKSLMMSS